MFPDRVRFTVEFTRLDYGEGGQAVTGHGRITLYLLHTPPETVRQLAQTALLGAGERVRFEKLRLRRPKNFNNPGNFDYRLYLENRGILVTGSLSHAQGVQRLGAFSPALARRHPGPAAGKNAGGPSPPVLW